MPLIDGLNLRKKEASTSRSFTDEELEVVLSCWKESGREYDASPLFDPPLSVEECERALAFALRKWPQDFDAVLANEGVSDVSIARAQKEMLVSGDPKALMGKVKTAETLHKLKGRLKESESKFQQGVDATLELARILSGQAPMPKVIDIPPLALPSGEEE